MARARGPAFAPARSERHLREAVRLSFPMHLELSAEDFRGGRSVFRFQPDPLRARARDWLGDAGAA